MFHLNVLQHPVLCVTEYLQYNITWTICRVLFIMNLDLIFSRNKKCCGAKNLIIILLGALLNLEYFRIILTEPGDNLKCSFAVFLVLINIVKRGGDGSKSGVSFFDFCSRMLHCVGNISIKFHENTACKTKN